MNYTNKIISIFAMIIGIMAVVTGFGVLGGFYEPVYKYYLLLVSYNVIMGIISIITSIFIWVQKNNALVFSSLIAGAHFVVLILLLSFFDLMISDQSKGAMTFRFTVWLIISLILWRIKKKDTYGIKIDQ